MSRKNQILSGLCCIAINTLFWTMLGLTIIAGPL